MTPEEHVSSVENAISEAYERQLGDARRELKRVQGDLASANEELSKLKSQNQAIVADTTRQLQDAHAIVQQTFGGDWKDLVLVFGSMISGFALGWWIQRTFDARVPWMSIIGVGLAGAGMFGKGWSLTTRASLIVGGGGIALGSVVHAFIVEPEPQAPVSAPPVPQGVGA
ncbi:MAG: hypothetical protein H6729_00100 [Deltaproteobacteria bacterium]|nr:hypothetical protein [Deltaproteobacteria bacterium]